MSRTAKYDYEALKREYIYDSTPGRPVSLRDLAERHGMNLSLVTRRALPERWHEQRVEFRRQVGEKAIEKLHEDWVSFEAATRQKAMTVGLAYLDQYAAALTAGEIKVNTRDALGVIAMIRVMTADAAGARGNGEEALVDPDDVPISEEGARLILARLESGERGDEEESAPTGTEGAGAD